MTQYHVYDPRIGTYLGGQFLLDEAGRVELAEETAAYWLDQWMIGTEPLDSLDWETRRNIHEFTGGAVPLPPEPEAGAFAVSEEPDVASIAAISSSWGGMAASEMPDLASFRGVYNFPNEYAKLVAVERPDIANMFALVDLVGAIMQASEDPDVAEMTGQVIEEAVLEASEDPDVAVFYGGPTLTGAMHADEAPDEADIQGTGLTLLMTMAAVERPDVAAFTGVTLAGAMDADENPDVANMAGYTLGGQLATSEAPDVAAIVGGVTVSGGMTSTEAPDVAAMAGSIPGTVSLKATSVPTSASFFARTILNITKPADTVEGDLLVAFITRGRGSGDVNNFTGSPPGWTKVAGASSIVYGNYYRRTECFWKIAGAAEPASYSWSISTPVTHDFEGVIFSLTGAHQTAPMSAWAQQIGTGNLVGGPQGDYGLPDLTTAANGSLVFFINMDVCIYQYNRDPPPGGWTERYDACNAAAVVTALYVASKEFPTAGAVEDFTYSFTNRNDVAQPYWAALIAVRPP